jgi:LysR family transcriptional regulator, nitrogen assimilation regulatory protein
MLDAWRRCCLLDSGYGLRRAFDAACRLAGLRPNIRLASRFPHTLLVLAEAQHGVALIASTFRAHTYNLKIVRIVYRGRTLREPLAVLWDKRRPLPRYASGFCQTWADQRVKTALVESEPRFNKWLLGVMCGRVRRESGRR